MKNDCYIDIDTSDFAKLVDSLSKVEQLPQKVVTKAAGKGRTVVRRAIRGEAPVATGALKKGIVSRGERSKVKGKKVYDLMFDPGMNDVFQKPIKNPGVAGGKNKKGYYPASTEYGFLTRSKGGGYSYVPGYHFMKEASERNEQEAKAAIVQTMADELEKEWMK